MTRKAYINLDNNNVNMNMNTGRGISHAWAWVDNDDIWSNENLKNLIDMDIGGCESAHKRGNLADSISLKEEYGGDLLTASCRAVRKMMMFSTQLLADTVVNT